jgi:preprotein translocase subunit SecE
VENDNGKILTMSFLVAAAIVFFAVGMVIDTISGMSGSFARVAGNELVRAGLQVGLAAATFSLLRFKKNWVHFFDEVVMELRKIVWPSRKDVIAMTVVVCVMVMVCGLIFAIFDGLSVYVVTSLPQLVNNILQ